MTLMALWLKGMLHRRPGRLLGAIAGVAITVSLLGSMGAFIASAAANMTRRAIATVPVDWQIQLTPGADTSAVIRSLRKSTRYTSLQQVGYASVSGFTATTAGTTQTTGAGKVLGVSPSYFQTFPAEMRPLIGATHGVLLAQQTAANLHASPGSMVTVGRSGLSPVTLRVNGVVDLPNADSLFQAVGVPSNASPQAPPDNVMIIPSSLWEKLFGPQAAVRPDSVRIQLHVRLLHRFPPTPGAAYTEVEGMAHNLEARIAGSGVVGNNLAARLGGVREDALYAKVLFLFLGLPGAILAVTLTMAVAASGSDRRRKEQALLRTRGASTSQVLVVESVEALVVGFGGVVLGLTLVLLASRGLANHVRVAHSPALTWLIASGVIGILLAATAVILPAWSQARYSTVAAGRAEPRRTGEPVWQRAYVDFIVLALSGIVFWQTASTGYQIVLAPEGVPQTSVSYQAFISPVFFWVGVVLLSIRFSEYALDRHRRLVGILLRPLAGSLAGIVGASLARQRAIITRGIALVALAVSFAVATAVFNTTYAGQSRVDAELTNGADVTVTGPTSSPPGAVVNQLRSIPGVAAVQLMQHRFAYVGNDLQDIYGIDPRHIGTATNMSNAFFAGGNAKATLNALAHNPDGVLVSEETVHDFQLKPGDQINLRLQNATDHQYHVTPFHFVGVAREFPTAPKDSFLVANSSYISAHTGSAAEEIALLRVKGSIPKVATAARKIVSGLSGDRVTEIGTAQRTISTSLTAVNLSGLTRLELIYAVVLVAGSTGLILLLAMSERRRSFAILSALGAHSSQLGAFQWSEGFLILSAGGVIGSLLGFGVAQMLVKLLTGVFDPPPEALNVPWLYLGGLAVAAVAATALAVLAAQAVSRRSVVEALREL